MKRYLIFAGSDHYPSGGMQDLIGTTGTVEESKELARKERLKYYNEYTDQTEEEYLKWEWEMNWAHIYDTKEERIILEIGSGVTEWQEIVKNIKE